MYSQNTYIPLIPIEQNPPSQVSPNTRRSQAVSLAIIINKKEKQLKDLKLQFRQLQSDICKLKSHFNADQKDKLYGQICCFKTNLFRVQQILDKARHDPNEYVAFVVNKLISSCEAYLQKLTDTIYDGIRQRVEHQIQESNRRLRLEELKRRRNAMVVREI